MSYSGNIQKESQTMGVQAAQGLTGERCRFVILKIEQWPPGVIETGEQADATY